MDKQTIFEHALTRLGEQQNRQTAETRQACETTYQRVLSMALARHRWSWSRVLATLTRKEDGHFTLPCDCLRLLSVYINKDTPARAFDIVGRTLIVPQAGNTIAICYQSNLSNLGGNVPDTSPYFIEGVICLLAAKISPIITGNPAPQTELEQEADRYLSKAATLDAFQTSSNDQHNLRRIRKLNIFR